MTGAAAARDDSIPADTKRCGLAWRNVFSDQARTVNVLELRRWSRVSVKPTRHSPFTFLENRLGEEKGRCVWCIRSYS